MLPLVVTSSPVLMKMTSSTTPKLKCGLIGLNGIPTAILDGIQTVLHQHHYQHRSRHQSLNQCQQRKHPINAQKKNSEFAILLTGHNIEPELPRVVFSFTQTKIPWSYMEITYLSDKISKIFQTENFNSTHHQISQLIYVLILFMLLQKFHKGKTNSNQWNGMTFQ